MKLESNKLIDDLLSKVERASESVRRFRQLELSDLQAKEDASRWSVLECIEHLNLYGDYYLPEIERSILSAPKGGNLTSFTPGLMGNYFANLMKVSADGKMKKMKSPADKNPAMSVLGITTLERFLKQQDRLLTLLWQAGRVDLTKTKTPISLTRLIKLRLGDTFRFFVYHIERHVLQAEGEVSKRAVRKAVVV